MDNIDYPEPDYYFPPNSDTVIFNDAYSTTASSFVKSSINPDKPQKLFVLGGQAHGQFLKPDQYQLNKRQMTFSTFKGVDWTKIYERSAVEAMAILPSELETTIYSIIDIYDEASDANHKILIDKKMIESPFFHKMCIERGFNY